MAKIKKDNAELSAEELEIKEAEEAAAALENESDEPKEKTAAEIAADLGEPIEKIQPIVDNLENLRDQERAKIDEAIETTFAARPDIIAAYRNGSQYFFSEQMAKHFLKEYTKISNPHYKG